MKKISILFASLFVIGSTYAQTTWTIDKSHSKVGFSVAHMVVSETEGNFKDFEGKVISKTEDFNGAEVEFTAKVASVNTENEKRDGHLKSADFFAAEQYPAIDFKGQLKLVSGSDYKLVGALTIRETTKDVELTAEFGGTVVDPWGNTKAGFELNGKINRKDFGLGWNALTEAGGMVVSEEVKLHINVELAKG